MASLTGYVPVDGEFAPVALVGQGEDEGDVLQPPHAQAVQPAAAHTRRMVLTQTQQQQPPPVTTTTVALYNPASNAHLAPNTRMLDMYGRTLHRDDLSGEMVPLPDAAALQTLDPAAYARRNNLVFDRQTSTFVSPAEMQRRMQAVRAPGDNELARRYVAQFGAPPSPAEIKLPLFGVVGRFVSGGCCGLGGLTDAELFALAYVPKRITSLALTQPNLWIALDKPFPVDVLARNRWSQGIGASIVYHYRVMSVFGAPLVLFALQKCTPFGVGVGGQLQWHGDMWEVPATWTVRKRFAITQIYQYDGNVNVLQDNGTQFTLPLADLTASQLPELVDAVKCLRRDYGALATAMFGARYVEPPAAIYTAGGMPKSYGQQMLPSAPFQQQQPEEYYDQEGADDQSVAPAASELVADAPRPLIMSSSTSYMYVPAI